MIHETVRIQRGLFAGAFLMLFAVVGFGVRAAQPAHAQPPPITVGKQTITLSAASAILAAAVDESAALGIASVVAVVDENGLLKALVRMDDAQVSSVQIAQDKAYTAAVRRQTSEAFANSLADNPTLLASQALQPHIFLAAGGIPIVVDGQVVGAVGSSGGTQAQSVQVATAGIAAIQ